MSMETTVKKESLVRGGLALVVLVAFYLLGSLYVTKETEEKKQAMASYTSTPAALSFEYPKGYYVFEKQVGTETNPQTTIVLVEDTEEHRNVVNNITEDAREWPTMITIDAYVNTKGLAPEVWAQQETTWKVSDKILRPAIIGVRPAVQYDWSGLYEGTSTIITSDTYAYVVSVTWMSADDQIRKDYAALLQTLVFE